MLEVNGGLNETIDVKWRTTVRTAVVTLDFLHPVVFGVYLAPNRLVRH